MRNTPIPGRRKLRAVERPVLERSGHERKVRRIRVAGIRARRHRFPRHRFLRHHFLKLHSRKHRFPSSPSPRGTSLFLRGHRPRRIGVRRRRTERPVGAISLGPRPNLLPFRRIAGERPRSYTCVAPLHELLALPGKGAGRRLFCGDAGPEAHERVIRIHGGVLVVADHVIAAAGD